MTSLQPGFNLRVYGILWSTDRQSILVVEEVVLGQRLVKFPGGGVEHLEAPGLALIREFKEELNVEVELADLTYVSPHFHLSIFRPQQLLGVYWEVRLKSGQPVPQHPQMKLHWRRLDRLDPQEFTHALDREVVRELMARCRVP